MICSAHGASDGAAFTAPFVETFGMKFMIAREASDAFPALVFLQTDVAILTAVFGGATCFACVEQQFWQNVGETDEFRDQGKVWHLKESDVELPHATMAYTDLQTMWLSATRLEVVDDCAQSVFHVS
jgi:hypothetical protein